MKLTPPTDIAVLARELGIGPTQLGKLLRKHDKDTVPVLRKWWSETRDTPRLLGKSGGIVDSAAGALRVVQPFEDRKPEDSGEAVDEEYQERFSTAAEVKAVVEFEVKLENARLALQALKDDPLCGPHSSKVRMAERQVGDLERRVRIGRAA